MHRSQPREDQVIMDMPPPRSIREVQKLAGKLAALNRFISRSADKGLPFFKVLRGVAKFEWNSTSQLAFDDLKSLGKVPLAVFGVRQEGMEHQPVYYVSKVCARG
ncbi:UNVERIFIED_CONTAM: hypothetical protein Slati_4597500 [Sesamum latifolium]|uniref:Uncharacterized protein n=1 Tax=Sesamum latifolium TaxID=2727402 RepID=A0AAW2S4G6_9LAMI